MANIDATDTINWNGGNGFSPIGNSTTNFTGQFDGQGHVISNLSVTLSATDDDRIVRGSQVARYKIGGLSSVVVNGGNYVGGLVGFNEGNVYELICKRHRQVAAVTILVD